MGQHQSVHELELEEQGIHQELVHKKEFNFVFWIGIVLLLLFLGFNIFSYLGDLGDYIKNLLSPILSFFGIAAGEATKQTLKVAGEGTKGIVDVVTGTASSGISLIQNRLSSQQKASKDSNEKPVKPTSGDDANVSKDSNESNESNDTKSQKSSSQSSQSSQPSHPHPPASHSHSSPPPSPFPKKMNSEKMDIHPSGVSAPIGINKSEKNSIGVAGYCFIGEEDGYRTCIKVGPRDTCYSGDIYPSRDKCINPNLR